jgi:sugar diacid utilization regulator
VSEKLDLPAVLSRLILLDAKLLTLFHSLASNKRSHKNSQNMIPGINDVVIMNTSVAGIVGRFGDTDISIKDYSLLQKWLAQMNQKHSCMFS